MSENKSSNWSNWSGSVQCTPIEIKTPATLQELQAIIRANAAKKTNIRVVGSGHSFTGLVGTTGTIVSLDLMQGIEWIRIVARLPFWQEQN
jgi:FAD/FMN-containing dehydrogenase